MMLYGHSPEECVISGIISITIGLVVYVSGCVLKLPPVVVENPCGYWVWFALFQCAPCHPTQGPQAQEDAQHIPSHSDEYLWLSWILHRIETRGPGGFPPPLFPVFLPLTPSWPGCVSPSCSALDVSTCSFQQSSLLWSLSAAPDRNLSIVDWISTSSPWPYQHPISRLQILLLQRNRIIWQIICSHDYFTFKHFKHLIC